MSFKKFYLKEDEEKFNKDSIDTFQSFSKKAQYVARFFPKIGQGSSRIVFDMGDGNVLKLAKNVKGYDQNNTEGDWGMQKMYPDIVPELIDKDEEDDCSWLIMKKGTKMTPSKFQALSKVSWQDFTKAISEADLDYRGKIKKSDMSEKTKEMLNDEDSLVYQVADLMINFDMPPGDICRLASWGDFNGKVRLLDLGFNNTVARTHYQPKKR